MGYGINFVSKLLLMCLVWIVFMFNIIKFMFMLFVIFLIMIVGCLFFLIFFINLNFVKLFVCIMMVIMNDLR